MTQTRYLLTAGVLLALAFVGPADANWVETFNNDAFDQPDWVFLCYPDVAGTFSHSLKRDETGNDYLSLDETRSVGDMPPGSAFGFAGVVGEEFADVRVGAVVNVVGDSNRNYCALAGRASYTVNDGSQGGIPGALATGYLMMLDWEDGPANFQIDVRKMINLTNNMSRYELITVPGLGHTRSYYAELDIVGSGPVYITGSLYEYQGGPLVARTPTLVDTEGHDAWEKDDIYDPVLVRGISGVGGVNEQAAPAGYHTTFDDIRSVSDGPAAVCIAPVNGATEVSVEADLAWMPAAFAQSCELWFGAEDTMQKVDPNPTGNRHVPGSLEFGRTYQWRVDEIGPAGIVTGPLWTFTTGDCLVVDDFESCADDAAIAAAWVHNIPGDYLYVFRETSQRQHGGAAMRLSCENQFEPYFTEATRTFDAAQDWTRQGVTTLSLAFRGEEENAEQRLYVRIEDAAGVVATVAHPIRYAIQTEFWRRWDIDLVAFGDSGVDLTRVIKLTVGLGDGTPSGQAEDDLDTIYIDYIRLCPPADQ